MADPNSKPNGAPEPGAPGEVRSTLQVVVRILLVLVILALLIGLGVALVRLLSRPTAASIGTPTYSEQHLLGTT